MYNIYEGIKAYYDDDSFPRLISYPRTGSHWLRIMLEEYLEMPCGPQAFFYPDSPPWALHVHDRFVGQEAYQEGPVTNLKKVVYLHRDPIDTIFSQLKYEGFSEPTDREVDKLTEEYSLHIDRWLHNNEDISELFEITYEEMKLDTAASLRGILLFLGYAIDEDRIAKVCKQSSKSKTKSVTPHDPKALNAQSLNEPENYSFQKEAFKIKFGDRINNKFEGLR